jgi:hypothetical protein
VEIKSSHGTALDALWSKVSIIQTIEDSRLAFLHGVEFHGAFVPAPVQLVVVSFAYVVDGSWS